MSVDVKQQDRIATSQRERDLLKVMTPVLKVGGSRHSGRARRFSQL